MDSKSLVDQWFDAWKKGDYTSLPISDDFTHISPFGTIEGKKQYLELIEKNQDKFLGYQFKILDGIYKTDRACVRYKAIQGDFELDVSEWYYFDTNRIKKIVAYYHIGEIREDRALSS